MEYIEPEFFSCNKSYIRDTYAIANPHRVKFKEAFPFDGKEYFNTIVFFTDGTILHGDLLYKLYYLTVHAFHVNH